MTAHDIHRFSLMQHFLRGGRLAKLPVPPSLPSKRLGNLLRGAGHYVSMSDYNDSVSRDPRRRIGFYRKMAATLDLLPEMWSDLIECVLQDARGLRHAEDTPAVNDFQQVSAEKATTQMLKEILAAQMKSRHAGWCPVSNETYDLLTELIEETPPSGGNTDYVILGLNLLGVDNDFLHRPLHAALTEKTLSRVDGPPGKSGASRDPRFLRSAAAHLNHAAFCHSELTTPGLIRLNLELMALPNKELPRHIAPSAGGTNALAPADRKIFDYIAAQNETLRDLRSASADALCRHTEHAMENHGPSETGAIWNRANRQRLLDLRTTLSVLAIQDKACLDAIIKTVPAFATDSIPSGANGTFPI